MDQEELLRLTADSCCFVLPSRHEPWGVVIHEFAAAGLPLITSEACGASTHFLINNHNGYVCPTDDVPALSRAIGQIIAKSDEELLAFAQRSRALSRKISPQTTAANLLSVLKS
jgi:glycosyltransferase involved in cell wall biosynthesis